MYKLIKMKIKLWCTTLIGFCTINVNAQSCCSGGASANVSLGGNSESMIMPNQAIGVEVQNMFWSLQPSSHIILDGNSFADVNYVNVTSLGVHYGVADNLTISTVLPYVTVRSTVYGMSQGNMVRDIQNSSGTGDMSVLLSYKPLLNVFENLGVVLVGGVEAPTGYASQSNTNLVATLGSGSWDPVVGLGLKQQFNNDHLSVVFRSTYKLTTTNTQSINAGDFWSNTLQGVYSLTPNTENDASCNGSGDLKKVVSLGVGHDYLQPQEETEERLPNTGYHRVFGTIGTFLEYERFRFSVNGDLPLYEQLEGNQNESAFKIRAALLITLNNKR